MSQVQYSASGSEVSRVESDIAQTVNLADTVVSLIREPVILLYQNISKKKVLHASLGNWKDEALYETGQCRIPVLLEESLEAYLINTDGIVGGRLTEKASTEPQKRQRFRFSWGNNNGLNTMVKPQSLPSGTACWAYYLHSLGIRPGMEVAGWRPPIDGFINTQNGGVEMEIDGSALCHVINLYSTLPRPGRDGTRMIRIRPDLEEAKSYTFNFGRLAWDSVNGQLHAHFTPGVETELNAAKTPFGEVGTHMDTGTIMASYLKALDHGASDRKFLLPLPKAPLNERVSALTSCLRQLREDTHDALLLSSDWIKEACRIKRKVLTQGGEDDSFYQDICETLDLIPYNRSWGSESSEKTGLKDEIYRLFPFGNDGPLSCVGPGPRGYPSEPDYFIRTREVIRKTLEGYSDQPPESWRGQLFGLKDEVIELMFHSNQVVVGRNVHILRFTRSSDLWDEKVLLGAPVGTVSPS